MSTVEEYFRYYKKFLAHSWDNMGPYEYVVILFAVGIIGWYLMRKGPTTG